MELGGINRPGEEKVFLISTTHGGETHAMSACMATMKVFKEQNVIAHNHSMGDLLISKVRDAIAKKGLSDYVSLSDSNWMVAFGFKNKDKAVDNGLRTLFMQEMIKRGVLFQGVFVPCFSHQTKDVDFFTEAVFESLEIFGRALASGYQQFLIGEPTKPVFRKFL